MCPGVRAVSIPEKAAPVSNEASQRRCLSVISMRRPSVPAEGRRLCSEAGDTFWVPGLAGLSSQPVAASAVPEVL